MMTFKERLPYFLGGLTIGIMVVIFVFNKKNTTFDYGPNARVLKNLRTKDRIYTIEATNTLDKYALDSSVVSAILNRGNVNLMDKIKLDSCFYQYEIRGKKELKNLQLTVKNCDSTIVITQILVDEPQ